MDISIFTDRQLVPTDEALQTALGETEALWQQIRNCALTKYPAAIEDWNYPGQKYGWSFRIKDKKRAILYLLPRQGWFYAAFVFGQKACEKIWASTLTDTVKDELRNARQYAEGRGIRIRVADASPLGEIYQLIDIKLSH